MHPFLMHAYTQQPVARQNQRLNDIINRLNELVDYAFIDELEDEFMGNFPELDPDSDCPAYEFGLFDNEQSAKEFILAELDADWWITYYSNILELEEEWRHYREIALEHYEVLSSPAYRGVLETVIPLFRGMEDAPFEPGSTPHHFYMEKWERGVLLETLPKRWWKPFSILLEHARRRRQDQ